LIDYNYKYCRATKCKHTIILSIFKQRDERSKKLMTLNHTTYMFKLKKGPQQSCHSNRIMNLNIQLMLMYQWTKGLRTVEILFLIPHNKLQKISRLIRKSLNKMLPQKIQGYPKKKTFCQDTPLNDPNQYFHLHLLNSVLETL
jgi:hypothetical protein